MPKVSVIIPVYNVEKYLRECLDSIIHQTLNDIEIILVNDDSPDNSLDIIKEYASTDKRIVVIDQENCGCNKTRNNTIEIANGDYISFIDSDDIIDLDYFEKLYNATKNGKFDIAMTSKVVNFSEDNKYYKNTGAKDKIYTIKSLKDRGKIVITSGMSCNKIYKTDFIKKNNIKFSTLNRTGGDNGFTAIAMLLADRIAVINNTAYHYRQQKKSLTKTLKNEQHFGIVDIYKEIKNTVKTSKVSILTKRYWLNNVVNKRAYKDIIGHYLEMEPRCKNKFKEFAKKNFPDINIKKEIIVSLTSYPRRISTVHLAIESILKQSFKADKVLLWLAEEEFPNKEKDLPKQLLDLIPQGLTIKWCNNIKSYKKLIPALKEYPDSIIITADDDIIYNPKCIETLVKTYKKYPNCIIANRAHLIIQSDDGTLLPYNKWEKEACHYLPSYNLFLTSGATTLFYPGCFHRDVLNEELFLKLAQNSDDIWFWAMAVLNNVKIKLASPHYDKIVCIKDSQNEALYIDNNHNGNNDKNLKLVTTYYPEILKKLRNITVLYKNPIEKVFSVKRDISRKHKVLTVLGIKFKLSVSSAEKELLDKISKLENQVSELRSANQNLQNKKYSLNFKNFQEMTNTIRKNLHILDSDFDLIVGVPRSGIIPAYLIALFLNKQVCSLNEFINNLVPLKGERPILEIENKKRKILIVDDSIQSGKALNKTKELIEKANLPDCEFKFCCVYATETSKDLIDYHFETVEQPRLFQWNYLNSYYSKFTCFDMDGVLCVDPTDEQNDDGEKYIDFIKNAKPLYIPTYKINAIVTSRLEKYRKETEEWLKKHNVQYEHLYMLDLPTATERQQLGCHAEFKAKIYGKKENCSIFVESNRKQAMKIAEITGKKCICVETDECF